MRLHGLQVDALRIVKRGVRVGQTDDLYPRLEIQRLRGHRPHVAEALDDRRPARGLDLERIQRPLDQKRHAAPGGFPPSRRTAQEHGLAGDDLVDRMPHVGAVGVHEPRHDLFVGAHVRTHDVGVRPDEGDHFLHVAAADGFQLADGKFARVARHAALGTAVGQPGERAFPAHPDRERGDLAHVDARGEARAALGRPHGEMVLDAVAGKNAHAAVVAVDGQRDHDRAFGQQEPVAVVGGNIEVIGDQAELLAGHVESRVRVDGRGGKHPRENYASCPESATFRPFTAAGTDG